MDLDMVCSHRRQFLAGCSAIAGIILAGCSSGEATPTQYPSPAPYETLQFTIWNEDDDQHNLTLKVARGGSVLFERTYTVPPKSQDFLKTDVEYTGLYEITAGTEVGNPDTLEWDGTTNGGTRSITATIQHGHATVVLGYARATYA